MITIYFDQKAQPHLLYSVITRDAGEGGRGGQAPLLPFLKGARGAKVPIQCKSIIDFDNIIVPFEMRTGGDIAKNCRIKTLFTLVEKLLLHFKPI